MDGAPTPCQQVHPAMVGVAQRKAAAGNTCCRVITPRQTDTPSQTEQSWPSLHQAAAAAGRLHSRGNAGEDVHPGYRELMVLILKSKDFTVKKKLNFFHNISVVRIETNVHSVHSSVRQCCVVCRSSSWWKCISCFSSNISSSEHAKILNSLCKMFALLGFYFGKWIKTYLAL